jgi:hypothetical protein
LDDWLTAKEMKERILNISNNKSVTKKDSDAYKQLFSYAISLNNVNGTMENMPFQKTTIMLNFLKYVSALNLASLLENKNNYILNNLLKMPAKYRQYLGSKPIENHIFQLMRNTDYWTTLLILGCV